MQPMWPPNLQVLDLAHNKIHSLVMPFPPKLQRLNVAGSERLSDDVRPRDWIEALPLTLRELDVWSCFLDDRVGQMLVAAKERVGLTRAGVSRLRVVTDAKDKGKPTNGFATETVAALDAIVQM
ncbi:hypothetical protein AMAG_00464 [Allomyces macrogynus ATCC 38327]|uniref:Uncharacterized protein n=1 Tax=Allomyces macrogynus (strain ATCC 38327) TaxID=578462 RepID=A0A0L0RW18_ALLM3|nr:hypothetical protein AMAG_00464 [Allomyces macrogynus ATCC 38327]|eukprot:KNE54493.1 hypothetical protein AMAG_00464 [Allomyces macrogynus ATCC 38327]